MTTVRGLKGGINTQITQGGQPVLVVPPLTAGKGRITNPINDQNIPYLETLYISLVSSSPSLYENNTTTALYPGQSMETPANSTFGVYANAATSGHSFSAYYVSLASTYPPAPVPGNFPPSSPTTMTIVIGSYLYKEYDDDDDLQAFVYSYNVLAQRFIDTLNALNLPIYTQDATSGLLLDWIGAGIYGIPRPSLSSNQGSVVGPFNTYTFNAVQLNGSYFNGPTNIVATSDDTYKRLLTWALMKSDGKICDIRWLKRRIMRFLIGVNGTCPNIDNTDQISITFGPNNEIAIKFIDQIATRGFGAIFDGFGFNTAMFNQQNIIITPLTPLPYRQIFKEAVETGAIELPFQFNWNVYL